MHLKLHREGNELGNVTRNPWCWQSFLPIRVQIRCPSSFWCTTPGNLLMAAWEIKSRFLKHYLFQQQWQQEPPFSCFCLRCSTLLTHSVIQWAKTHHFIFLSLVILCYSLKTSAQLFRLLSEFLSLCQMLKDWFRQTVNLCIRCSWGNPCTGKIWTCSYRNATVSSTLRVLIITEGFINLSGRLALSKSRLLLF